jgi:hypothetical protein
MNIPSTGEGLSLSSTGGEGREEEALFILECSSCVASPALKSLFIRDAIHHNPRGRHRFPARARNVNLPFAICHVLLAISAAALPRYVHPRLPTP